MRLYGVRGWGSAISEFMLAMAGEHYDFVDVSGFDAPGATREMLAEINPLAQVPTLVLDDGEVLTESGAIGLWLLDRHPELGPHRGTRDHARFLRLLVWIVANVYPTFTYGDYPERWCPSAPAELDASTDRRREELYLWLEEQVAGPYVLGEQPSLLDCYVAVLLAWRPRLPWFEEHAPKLVAAGELTRSLPGIEPLVTANGLPRSTA